MGVLAALFLSMPFVSSIYVKIWTVGRMYQSAETVPAKDSALVLGAAAYGKRLSDVLQDRVDTAIELYKDKKVEKLIMSGAPNETVAMKLYAIEKGIPNEDVIEDPKGLNTLASVQNAIDRNESLIIVTQRFHLARALFMADHYNIDAVGLTADRQEYGKLYEFRKRELLATSKMMLNLFFIP